jgi:hypothetical protein
MWGVNELFVLVSMSGVLFCQPQHYLTWQIVLHRSTYTDDTKPGMEMCSSCVANMAAEEERLKQLDIVLLDDAHRLDGVVSKAQVVFGIVQLFFFCKA